MKETNYSELQSTAKTQEFPGKQDFLLFLEDETLEYFNEEKNDTSEYISKYERYVERKPKSEFQNSQRPIFIEMIGVMKKHKDGECLVQFFRKEPFYIYGLFLDEKTNCIFGCIKSLDIQKTPERIWNKLLGIPMTYIKNLRKYFQMQK